MTFTELVEDVSKSTKLDKIQVASVLRATVERIRTSALSGEQVNIPSFGKFSKKVQKPRKAFGVLTKHKESVKFSPYSESVKVSE